MAKITYSQDKKKVIVNGKEYSKLDFEKTYIDQNLSYDQMTTYFDVSLRNVQSILKYFGIKKDPKLVSLNRQKNLLEKYGVTNVSQIAEVKVKKEQSAMEKYGVDNISKAMEVQLKKEETFKKHYGKSFYFQTEEFKESNRGYWLENYGVVGPSQTQTFKSKASKTIMEKYGVAWNCMRQEARCKGSNNSKPNADFSNLLDEYGISYQREFTVNNKSFDFKIGNILLEINPTATHNIEWSPFGHDHVSSIGVGYHKEKTRIAQQEGYRCIHVWDWDNKTGILSLLKERKTVFARKCQIREVVKEEAVKFINTIHIQGYAESKINIGLYYEEELVSVMTFDKPRYNKKYQYELIRYCSKYNVIGGAEKIFKYFIMAFSPESVVSYCDLSKFNGDTYKKLGFFKIRDSSPSLHWYNMKTHCHYSDSLIRLKGFSRIVHHCEPSEDNCDTDDNYQLMLAEGFLPVYDCGQATYIWTKG